MQIRSKVSRRIFWMTGLVLVVISTIGWLRFQQALRLWYYLIDLGLRPAPIYLAASGGLIGISHSLGLAFHLAKLPFTPIYLRVINVILLLWLWIDRVFIGIRDFFNLWLAGTILISFVLIACDLIIYRRIAYQQKVKTYASEN